MNEITMRPKYSRQTGTQRNRRKESNDDFLSITFAVQLLVVVVFLSVFALCKAANTPATDIFISKVSVVATSNCNSSKYIQNMIDAFGIKLPDKEQQGGNVSTGNDFDSNENSDGQSADTSNNGIAIDNKDISGNTASDSGGAADNSAGSPGAEVAEDSEIKAIADKYAFITPIKGEYVSLFGTRTDPLTGKPDFHYGLDIKANMGASIKAALAGEVTEVGSGPAYGNYIKIKHNDGISTIYAFCSTLIAKKGQKVNQGDVIAKVGDAENMSGSLHFEVWKDNKAVDPEKLLNYLNQ